MTICRMPRLLRKVPGLDWPATDVETSRPTLCASGKYQPTTCQPAGEESPRAPSASATDPSLSGRSPDWTMKVARYPSRKASAPPAAPQWQVGSPAGV
jgi:hypothetical protein